MLDEVKDETKIEHLLEATELMERASKLCADMLALIRGQGDSATKGRKMAHLFNRDPQAYSLMAVATALPTQNINQERLLEIMLVATNLGSLAYDGGRSVEDTVQ